MNILIRSAKIVDPGSGHHQKVKDVFIQNGVIAQIGNKLKPGGKFIEIKFAELHLSIGWIDLNSHFADPGFEQKETIETGCRAAAAGGFTHVCMMPNTQPAVQNKSSIEYVRSKAQDNVVTVLPVGAITENCQGKELAELYDMYHAGAIAFSDGCQPSLPAGLLERALDYVKAFNGIIFIHPEDKSISKNGVVHEGVHGTLLGLPMMPGFAEELAIARDLFVLEYTRSRLHFLDVSLKKSTELIRDAKKRKLSVTASVNAHHLFFTDKDVSDYHTNFKVNPPFRTQEDVQALVQAIRDNTIDTITSQHIPQEQDAKKMEFDKAEFGVIGLETSFAAANTVLSNQLSTTEIVALFSENGRKILNLPIHRIEEGNTADLTLFSPTYEWVFTEKDIYSKAANSPFIGQKLTGKPLGIIHKNKFFFAQEIDPQK
jgi:dihydroorotase